MPTTSRCGECGTVLDALAMAQGKHHKADCSRLSLEFAFEQYFEKEALKRQYKEKHSGPGYRIYGNSVWNVGYTIVTPIGNTTILNFKIAPEYAVNTTEFNCRWLPNERWLHNAEQMNHQELALAIFDFVAQQT
ncbi:MAG: hypothetical protein ACRD3W_25015 [Terriglobales bacterium]